MPRKGFVSRRTVRPDAVYDSDLVQKFINSMMWDGKRSTAQRIFYTAMEMVGQKGNDEPLKLFKKAVENVKPVLEVKSRRVGGANYQVPVEVPQRRGRTLALRWIVTFARDRREKHMTDKLAAEILDALEQQGNAYKRKDDMYRMAQANKAFAHYRW
jgi:small subunit ribosomal protein S7